MKQKNATPTASAPSIFHEASGSICFVFQDAAAPDAAHALLSKARTIEGKTIASILYHKTDWPSADSMSGSWMSLYILGLTIVVMVQSRLCPFSLLLSRWRLALMKLDHDDDLEKRRQLLNWNQNHRWVTLAFNNFHKIAMKYLIPMKILLILQKMK